MGTQQILLIVLSVIIVGIAVAVGISMFNQQSVNSARQAIVSDMNNFAVQAQAFYKTPTSMGGAGYDNGNVTAAKLRAFIGSTLTNDNGTYYIDTSTAGSVTFGVTPNESNLNAAGKCPRLTIDLTTGQITTNTAADPMTADQ